MRREKVMSIRMKKIYEMPEVKVVHCASVEMLCHSAVSGGGDDDGWVDEGEALVGPSRNEWEEIW